jgi:hypothetical protein
MSSDLLRRAASGIRAEFADANDWMTESERSFYLAVADWLDNVWLNEPVADEEMSHALAYLGDLS